MGLRGCCCMLFPAPGRMLEDPGPAGAAPQICSADPLGLVAAVAAVAAPIAADAVAAVTRHLGRAAVSLHHGV